MVVPRCCVIFHLLRTFSRIVFASVKDSIESSGILYFSIISSVYLKKIQEYLDLIGLRRANTRF